MALSRKSLLVYSLIFFIFFAVFGARKIIHQFIPGFHEYETIFIYFSDIFLLAFIILGFPFIKSIFSRENILPIVLLVIFEFFAFISIFLAFSKGLALYNFIRLELLMFFAVILSCVIKLGVIKVKTILRSLGFLAVIQALIVVGQFAVQKSMGIYILGESFLGQDVLGVAKIPVAGSSLIRGYGTFPHPNVLASFLIIGLISLYWFYINSDWKILGFSYNKSKSVRENFKNYIIQSKFYKRILISVSIGIVLLGLLLTFSRSAWGIAALLTIFFIVRLFFNDNYRGAAGRLLVTLFAISSLLFTIFSWVILPRASLSINEPAVSERISYNQIGGELIRDNFFGVGIGNQVLHSVKNDIYQDRANMKESYMWQPIHNLYILIASEIGVLGALSLISFLLWLLWRSFSITDYKLQITTAIMLLALLGLGLFDHFLWTLEPGRIMLWLIIGTIFGVLQSSNLSLRDTQL